MLAHTQDSSLHKKGVNPLVGFTPFLYILQLFHSSRAVALGIGGAAPELLAGVDAFARHSFYHGFAALRTLWGGVLSALVCSVCQTLLRQCLGEAAFLTECCEQMLYLFVEHKGEAIA